MNDKIELLNCPFCGGEAIAFPCAGQYYAKCVPCQIEVVRRTPEEAYFAWNRREPTIQQLQDRIKQLEGERDAYKSLYEDETGI